jgi:excinuclease UvrABC nuclease subunit
MVSDALRFATGEREKWYDHWEKLMKAAAAEQAFEQAAHHKQRLDRAREIEQNAFQLVRPVEQFNYLVLQRGSTRSRIQPFFVTAGVIHPGEQVRLKELDQVAGDWTARMHGEAGKTLTENGSQEEGVCDLPSRSEQIWLVSHFLLKKDDPGLLIHEAHLPEPDELADKTQRHFAPQKPSAGPQSGQSGAES